MMEFLKKLWANIIEELNKNDDIDHNFQLVISNQSNKKTRSVQKPNKTKPSII